ncbi:hypothetical protein [Spiroplasma clarkii]|uniref:Uncharacterized protein n=1 Tax=Spiroplasma clarkii TaxID=2139 RepID=A0A2K8KKP9_9MOLU|nr:hypothetical protein [Spiroplasma clarkii]ATX71049.1 hypothetical protein SCLAR_v1c07320 [Spiroplasma clarkii]
MSKKNQDNVDQIFEELMSLRKDKQPTNTEKTNEPKSLLSIINHAKATMSQVNASKWADPDDDTEKQKQLKAKGKSMYDADVLRESILKKQAEKRAGNSFEALRATIKKNKEEYEK